MALGSPVGSPTNPPYLSTASPFNHMASPMSHNLAGGGGNMVAPPQSGQSGFLPGFLMGDPSNVGTLRSPSKLNRSMSQNTGGAPQTPAGSGATPTQHRVNGFLTPSTPGANASTPGGALRTPGEKSATGGGPPISGLYSTPKQRRALHHASVSAAGTPIAGNTSMGTPILGAHQLSSAGTPTPNLNGTTHDLGNR